MGFFTLLEKWSKGDPLSPVLFILYSKVLFRALNSLFKYQQFVGFGMPKWSSNLNHLTYVDDTIIFSSTNAYSLEKIMSTLQKYEKQSG